MGPRDRVVVVDVEHRLAARGRDSAVVCGAVFDTLAADARTLLVEADSDHADGFPDDIRTARDWLRARALSRTDSDPSAPVRISITDDTAWAIGRAFAPWSVRAGLFDHDGLGVASFDDAGRSVVADLTGRQQLELSRRLTPAYSVVLLAEVEDETSDDLPPGRRRARTRLGALSER